MQQIEIFTDGACRGNPGPGGWGAILRYNKIEKHHSCNAQYEKLGNDSGWLRGN